MEGAGLKQARPIRALHLKSGLELSWLREAGLPGIAICSLLYIYKSVHALFCIRTSYQSVVSSPAIPMQVVVVQGKGFGDITVKYITIS